MKQKLQKDVRITIEVQPEIRYKLKSKAALEGETIKSKLLSLISHYLKK